MKKLSKQALDGNVEAMLLTVLADQSSYAYAIVKMLNQKATGIVKFGQGTVYPLLHRMEQKQLVRSETGKAENGRTRKYYEITEKGRAALDNHRQQWEMLCELIERFYNPQPAAQQNKPLAGNIKVSASLQRYIDKITASDI